MEQNSNNMFINLNEGKSIDGVSLKEGKTPIWNDSKEDYEKDVAGQYVFEDSIIVRAKNNIQVNWKLMGTKSRDNKEPYAIRLPYDKEVVDGKDVFDKSTIVLAVPKSQLETPQQVTDFNFKIRDTRTFSRELVNEENRIKAMFGPDKETLEMQKAFAEKGEKIPEAVFVYRNPEKDYANGEVLATGKYWVAVANGENTSEKKNYIRLINASRLLGKGEFADPEKALKTKCPIGEKLHFKFDDKTGQIEVSPYVPTQAKEALQDHQIEAMIDKRRTQSVPVQAPAQEPEPAKEANTPVSVEKEDKAVGKSKAKAKANDQVNEAPQPEAAQDEKKPAARRSKAKVQEQERAM